MVYRREDSTGSLVVAAIAFFIPVLLLLALRVGMLLQRRVQSLRDEALRDRPYRLTEPVGVPGPRPR
jgi:hypothetical protein